MTPDILIGADGIHSAVRGSAFGPDRPEYSGTVSYRAIMPAERLAGLDFPDNASWLGPGKHFVHYRVRGGTLLNVVAAVRAAPVEDSWTVQVEPAEGLAVFAGWDARVLGILSKVRTLYCRGIFTRGTLSAWGQGRVALPGDTAHAMVPFQAQGAAQSIVDAAVLARCLTDIAAPAAALHNYSELRGAKVYDVQRRSMNQGHLYHLTDGPESEARDRAMAAKAEEQPFGVAADLWAEDACAG